MKDYVEQRLKALRGEFDIGQKQLATLEVRIADLKQTLFRISGAIQVLEDVLTHEQALGGGSHHAPLEPAPPAD